MNACDSRLSGTRLATTVLFSPLLPISSTPFAWHILTSQQTKDNNQQQHEIPYYKLFSGFTSLHVSQNHRIVEVEGIFRERLWVQTLIKKGSARAACSGSQSVGFWASWTSESFWVTLQCLSILPSREVFLMCKWNILYFGLRPLFTTEKSLTLPSLFFFHQIFIHTDKMLPSLLFLRLNSCSVLNFS